MKTLNFLAMFLIASMLFQSCKKDEDKGTPRQTTKTYAFNRILVGTAGVKGELPPSEIKLSDIIGIAPALNLTNAEMQLASSYIEIMGLTQIEVSEGEAAELKDFSIKVGTRPVVNLGTCTTDPQGANEFAADIQQSTNQIINLIQNIFADITTGSKSTTITVSFTPNISITSADNVYLKISMAGTYFYLEFE